MEPRVRITIRAASSDLYDEIFAAHELIFRGHIERIWGWHPEWQRQNFSSKWRECDTQVIECDGTRVGYFQTSSFPDHIFLRTLGILPSHQSQGIGRHIMEGLKNQATASGRAIKLYVYVTNERAERFYERLDFRHEQRDREFQHMTWKDLNQPLHNQSGFKNT